MILLIIIFGIMAHFTSPLLSFTPPRSTTPQPNGFSPLNMGLFHKSPLPDLFNLSQNLLNSPKGNYSSPFTPGQVIPVVQPGTDNKENTPVVSPAAAMASSAQNVVRFTRTKRLGAGAFGEVWLGHSPQNPDASPVALKRSMPEDMAYKAALKEKMFFELHAERKTRHHMPPISHYESTPKKVRGENKRLVTQPTYTIATIYVPGGDLYHSFLSSKAPQSSLTCAEIKTITKQLLEFIADSKEIVHGDLKPENLYFLRSTHQLFVGDYGLSSRPGMEGNPPCCFTAPYRPPEEFLSYDEYDSEHGPQRDSSGDIWGVGCILFELYTGQKLFPEVDTNGSQEEINTYLQMIAFQLGALPPREFINKLMVTQGQHRYFNLPRGKDKPITFKKTIKLPSMDPWRQTLRNGALAKGASPAEISQIIGLIESMLKYTERANAAELLKHPYFETDIDFHLSGNFSSSDVVEIFTLSDVQKGERATPTLLIENPTKFTHCFHIPQEMEYQIIVTRDNKQIYSERWTIEKEENVLLELPLPSEASQETSIARPTKTRKRLSYAEGNTLNELPNS